jgi:hypothetical protein
MLLGAFAGAAIVLNVGIAPALGLAGVLWAITAS